MTAEATVPVRVKPGSSRTRVGGAYPGPYGQAVVVAVNARPVDGAATEAAVRAVAEALNIRPRDVRVLAGHTSRDKLLAISTPPPDLEATIRNLLASR
jgi:uncharacterized protein YggU (UPF0235/DUF167 family)